MVTRIQRGAGRLLNLLVRLPGTASAGESAVSGSSAAGDASTLISHRHLMEASWCASWGGPMGTAPSTMASRAGSTGGFWASLARRRWHGGNRWLGSWGSRTVHAAAAEQPQPQAAYGAGGSSGRGGAFLGRPPRTGPAALPQRVAEPPVASRDSLSSFTLTTPYALNGTAYSALPSPPRQAGSSSGSSASTSSNSPAAAAAAAAAAAGQRSSDPQAAAAAAAAAAPTLWLEGTVQRVQFRCPNTAYTVLKVQVSTTQEMEAEASAAGARALFAPKPRGGRRAAGASAAPSSPSAPGPYRPRKLSINVVGSLPQVAVGQCLRFAGGWGEHRNFGWQFRATDMQELSPQSDTDLVAYLGGGVIPGVGAITAQRMVEKWGADIERVLDSAKAVECLRQCTGIGPKTAERIKAGWDMNRGTREGVMFLREHGIPIPLAQRVADQWGAATRATVERDPYLALSGLGLPFSKVDQLAAKVGAAHDLVSRAGLALGEVLAAGAADGGHSYLPWSALEPRARRLLSDAGEQSGHEWPHPESLHFVAQYMHATGGGLVAEPALGPCPPSSTAPAAAPAELGAQSLAAEGSQGAQLGLAAAAQQQQQEQQQEPAAAGGQAWQVGHIHPTLESEDELKAYLRSHIANLSDVLASSMVKTHGPAILAVLDASNEEATTQLRKCRGIGPQLSGRFKSRWDAAFGRAPAAGASPAGAATAAGGPAAAAAGAGLRMSDLLARPAEVGFEWCPGTRCYTPLLHQAERVVAERVLSKAAQYKRPSEATLRKIRAWVAQNQKEHSLELSEGQRAAIEVASDAPIMVLTGGPGCGKTSTVQTIVKLWGAQGKLVRICAPTGRAAQRMGMIQGIEPCTIHRLLRYAPRRASDGSLAPTDSASEEATLGEGGSFEHNRSNPLQAKAVLVDEASMLSLPLAAALMDALTGKCQLVLVGDVDQLPPVGPGSVLHSLIQSGLVPVVDLREIFRQAAESCIVTSAVAVRRGEPPALLPVRPLPHELAEAASDALWVEASGNEDLPDTVRKTVWALTASGCFAGPEHLQVISPMRKGPAGTTTLNPLLQQLLNPPDPSKPELARHAGAHGGTAGGGTAGTTVFRAGDRVIQLINNYDKDIFNGDQGIIVGVQPSERRLVVRFPRAPSAESPSDPHHVDVVYQGQELAQLELAYAITVHKAQGGEARHVVLALSGQHGRMLTRRLLYTGLTRAKEQLIVVAHGGPHSPVVRAVQRAEHGERLSSLQERLVAGLEARGLQVHTARVYSNENEVLQLHHLPTGEEPVLVEAAAAAVDNAAAGVVDVTDDAAAAVGAQQDGQDAAQAATAAAAAAAAATPRKRRGRPASSKASASNSSSGGGSSGSKGGSDGGKQAAAGLLDGLPPQGAQNAEYLLEQGLQQERLAQLRPLLQQAAQGDLRQAAPQLLRLLGQEMGRGVSLALVAAHAPRVLFSTPQEAASRLQFLQKCHSVMQQAAREMEGSKQHWLDGAAGQGRAWAAGVEGQAEGQPNSSGDALPGSGWEGDSLVDQLARLKAICDLLKQQEEARRQQLLAAAAAKEAPQQQQH